MNSTLILPDPSILVMLSGGLDSTAVLYLALTQKEYEKYHIHCHHAILENIENRAQAESTAVSRIYQQLRTKWSFTTSESRHQYPVINIGFQWDFDIIAFIAGAICSSAKTIKKVFYGAIKQDQDPFRRARFARGERIFKAFQSAELVYPLHHLEKPEVYAILPPEIRNLTWSCRTPTYVNGNPQKCGKCFTCEQLAECKSCPTRI